MTELATINSDAKPERDRYGRPRIKRPDGSAVYYTRCTTFVGAHEDQRLLTNWKLRQSAFGLAARDDLRLAVLAHRDDKTEMDRLCSEAMDYAEAHAKATKGTAMHSICEQHDRGQDVPKGLPSDAATALAAYAAATVDLKHVHIEQMTVYDEFKVAGTPDRVVEWNGRRYIADLKGLALTTPIPTPNGWTTMGAVEVGDQVFAADGTVCTVKAKSKVKQIGTYVVTFDDGSKVVCDTEHIWWTQAGYRRDLPPTAKPIAEVIDTLHYQGQANHRVPVAGVLDLPEVDLPMDPYLLGCWLGDGHTNRAVVTKCRDLFEVLGGDGVALGVEQVDKRSEVTISRTILGGAAQLRAAGVLGDKHVPDAYLRAGSAQRLRLLQGLMDTDGTWNTARRRAVFCSADKRLALGVEELLHTLGQRAHLSEFQSTGYGVTITAYTVEFSPVDIMPFRLPRKVAKFLGSAPKNLSQAKRRVIVSVEPGPDVPTACIGVDSADHTFLCGERMIPTHNTGRIDFGAGKIAAQLAMYSRSPNYDHATGSRWAHGADQDRGIVIELNVERGTCDLHWIDLNAGWDIVQVCKEVRRVRNIRDTQVLTRFGKVSDVTLHQALARSTGVTPASIASCIEAAQTRAELNELWESTGGIWSQVERDMASARAQVLAS
jgi:replicative DNA helicase